MPSPRDFYVGQPATVYAGNFDAPVRRHGGVCFQLHQRLTSNGMTAVTVRVKIHNPGSLSDAYDGLCPASAAMRKLWPDALIDMGGSSTVYATASGTVQDLTKLAGSTVKQGEVLCTVDSETVRGPDPERTA